MITITPIDGQDYSSKKAVIQAWLNNEQFQLLNTKQPITRNYAIENNFDIKLLVKYRKQTRTMILDIFQ